MADEGATQTNGTESEKVSEMLLGLDLTRSLRLAGLPLSVQFNKEDYSDKIRELISNTFNLLNENIEGVYRIPVDAIEGQEGEVHMVILFKSRVHRNRVFTQRAKLSAPIQVFSDANPLSNDGTPKRTTRSTARKTSESPEKPKPEMSSPEKVIKAEPIVKETVPESPEKAKIAPEAAVETPTNGTTPQKENVIVPELKTPEKSIDGDSPQKVSEPKTPEVKVDAEPELKLVEEPKSDEAAFKIPEEKPAEISMPEEKMEEHNSEVNIVEPENKVVEPENKVVEPENKVVEPENKVVEPENKVVEPEVEIVGQEIKISEAESDSGEPNSKAAKISDSDAQIDEAMKGAEESDMDKMEFCIEDEVTEDKQNSSQLDNKDDKNTSKEEIVNGEEEEGGSPNKKNVEPKYRIDWAGAPEFQWKKITPDQASEKCKLVLENVSLCDFFQPFMYQVMQRAKTIHFECNQPTVTKPPAPPATTEHNLLGKGRLVLTYMSDNQAMYNAASYLVFFRSPGNRRVKILLPQTHATTKMRVMLERRMGHVVDPHDNCAKLLVRKINEDVTEDQVKDCFPNYKDEIVSVEFKNNAQTERCAIVTLSDPVMAALVHIHHDWVNLNEAGGFSRVYHMSDILRDHLLPKYEAKLLNPNNQKNKRKNEDSVKNGPAGNKALDKGGKDEKDKAPEAKKPRTDNKDDRPNNTSFKDSQKGRGAGRGNRGSFDTKRGNNNNDRRSSGNFNTRGGQGNANRPAQRTPNFRPGANSVNSTGIGGGFRGSRGAMGGKSFETPTYRGNNNRAGRGGYSNAVASPRFDRNSMANRRGGPLNNGPAFGRNGPATSGPSFNRSGPSNNSGPGFGRSPVGGNRDDRWQGGVAPFSDRPRAGPGPGPGGPGPAMMSPGGGGVGGPSPQSTSGPGPSYQELAGLLMHQQQTLDYQTTLLKQQQVINELSTRMPTNNQQMPQYGRNSGGGAAPAAYNPRGSGGGYGRF